jgi:hypothetical protein
MALREPIRITKIGPLKGLYCLVLFLLTYLYLLLVHVEPLFLLFTSCLEDGPLKGHRFLTLFFLASHGLHRTCALYGSAFWVSMSTCNWTRSAHAQEV